MTSFYLATGLVSGIAAWVMFEVLQHRHPWLSLCFGYAVMFVIGWFWGPGAEEPDTPEPPACIETGRYRRLDESCGPGCSLVEHSKEWRCGDRLEWRSW